VLNLCILTILKYYFNILKIHKLIRLVKIHKQQYFNIVNTVNFNNFYLKDVLLIKFLKE